MRLMTMAWRNVWRNTRRSGVTIAAMTFSLLMMICTTSFYEGLIVKMEANIIEVEMGDIQIHVKDYLNKPSIYGSIEGAHDIAEALEAKRYQTSQRYLGSGLVASSETSSGAALFGVNVSDDADVSLVFERVTDGKWLNVSESRGVVIGRLLARTLGVTIDDELVLLGQAADGSMANDLYRVRGILGSISEVTDRRGVFMLADSFVDFYAMWGGAHRLVVRRPVGTELLEALAEVKEITVGQALEIKSWRELSPILATMIDSALQLLQLGFLVIYVAVVILLLNAMLMAIFERIREFGIMKAIGVSPGSVLQLILIEGAIQALVAVVLALLLSVPALWYLVNVGIDLGSLGGVSMMGMSLDPVWQGVVSAKTFAMPLTTMLIIIVLGILYPAIKAARITPLEAIHHQ
ncbi:MAG: FtsX-like permease family protein [Pseudomonadales bacterium]|nr:FtsX-like permease family protein [Pseudomonadales bacterium]